MKSNAEGWRNEYQRVLIELNNGNINEAITLAKCALRLYPEIYELWEILGVASQKQKSAIQALTAFQKAASINDRYATAHSNLGCALYEQGRTLEAIESCQKALAIDSNCSSAQYNLGLAFFKLGQHSKAEQCFQRATNSDPSLVDAQNGLGNSLYKQGRIPEAVEAYQKALTMCPRYAEVHNNLGVALRDQGRLKEACTSFQEALKIKPVFASAWRNAVSLSSFPIDDAAAHQLVALWSADTLVDQDRCELGFAIYNVFKRLGRLSSAFEYLEKANALRKSLLNYDVASDISLMNRLKLAAEDWSKCTVQTSHPVVPSPIFIVGMPRSGTTLVEQIISSHQSITGLGELPFVSQILGDLAENPPLNLEAQIKRLRANYYELVAERGTNTRYFVDKMPHNFLWLGILASALPEAKFVHVYRDPAATCWSNYERYYPEDGIGFCYGLADLVSYYKHYADLVRHYSKLLSQRIYHLNYDLLTENLEEEVKSVVRYLEVAFDPAMLSPHLNDRSVSTASAEQSRLPVYQNSSAAWRPFARFLNGAFDGLTAFKLDSDPSG